MLDRTVAPPFRKIESIDIQKAHSDVLSNGTPIHIINAGKQDIVKLELVLQSGKWFEKQNGDSFFTTKMLTEGTRYRTAAEFSNYIDKYGAFLELNPGFDFVDIGIYILNKYFAYLIPVVQELLYDAIFPENELQILKNNTLQEIRIKNEKNNILAVRKFRELVFGEKHPYGIDLGEEDIKHIERNALVNYYDQVFRNNLEIVLSGNVSTNHIKLTDQFLGKLVLSESQPNNPPEINTKKQKALIERPKSSQSSIRIGKLLFNKSHPDYLKMLVVNEILGGYFGSRLMKNIREEKGFTYGVYSRIMNFKNAGYFVVGTDVKKEFTQKTIDEIYKEIEILRNQPLGDEELQTVKNQMLGAFLSEINSAFALADKFKSIHFHGLGYAFYQDFINTVNHIQAKEIQQTAQEYLDPDSMTEVVVGGY